MGVKKGIEPFQNKGLFVLGVPPPDTFTISVKCPTFHPSGIRPSSKLRIQKFPVLERLEIHKPSLEQRLRLLL